jgi:hypothetical protein
MRGEEGAQLVCRIDQGPFYPDTGHSLWVSRTALHPRGPMPPLREPAVV